MRQRFRLKLDEVESTLGRYRALLDRNDESDYRIDDSRREHDMVARIDADLTRIRALDQNEQWMLDQELHDALGLELRQLQEHTVALPGFMYERLWSMRDDMKIQYRTMIVLEWFATGLAAVMIGVLVKLFYSWVFRPLRLLIKGSRFVAAGDFNYRIHLSGSDEMAELAAAMNDMTQRFQTIRDDLDRQVKVRTKQVVRSEQLASVGFLAAGVAHEINNPLASIAMCAESLEKRVDDVLDADDERHDVVCNYLRMIQEQAFRCKGITERLLDFSRMGDVERHDADLRQLVQSVIEMVRHLGKYKQKHVRLLEGPPVVAAVNSQQISQVLLNLIANGLDSVDVGGTVSIELTVEADQAVLLVADDGCGMTDEILEHLFEPFYTRSRSGQGTGLGLSIAYSIVADHDGHLEATSDGPDRGAQFRVSIPLQAPRKKERENQYQAA
jgi:signal transduction histidine kinase